MKKRKVSKLKLLMAIIILGLAALGWAIIYGGTKGINDDGYGPGPHQAS